MIFTDPFLALAEITRLVRETGLAYELRAEPIEDPRPGFPDIRWSVDTGDDDEKED